VVVAVRHNLNDQGSNPAESRYFSFHFFFLEKFSTVNFLINAPEKINSIFGLVH